MNTKAKTRVPSQHKYQSNKENCPGLSSGIKLQDYFPSFSNESNQSQQVHQQKPKLVNNSEVIKWLKKRHQKGAKAKYLKSNEEMKREEQMEGVFQKFDIDQSGTIELNELHCMFKAHGIEISKNELKSLFQIVDTDGSGSLSLDEFKKFSQNQQANKIFKGLMKKVRHQYRKYYGDYQNNYLPFNLNRLLDHLSHITKREKIVSKIEQNKFSYEHTADNIKSFIKLFILDEGGKDSVVKEDEAKFIEAIIHSGRGNEMEFIKAKMSPKKYGIARLDTKHLDELTQSALLKQQTLKRQTQRIGKQNTLQTTNLDNISENDSFCTDFSSEDEELQVDQESNQEESNKAKIPLQVQAIENRRDILKIIECARQKGKEQAKEEYSRMSKRANYDNSKSYLKTDHSSYEQGPPLRKRNGSDRRNLSNPSSYNTWITEASSREQPLKYESVHIKKPSMPLVGYVNYRTKQVAPLESRVPQQLAQMNQRKREDQTTVQANSISDYVTQQNQSKDFSNLTTNRIPKLQEKVEVPNQGVKLPGLMRSKQNLYEASTDKHNVMRTLLDSVKHNNNIPH